MSDTPEQLQQQIDGLKNTVANLIAQNKELQLHNTALNQSYSEQINLSVASKVAANRTAGELEEKGQALQQVKNELEELKKISASKEADAQKMVQDLLSEIAELQRELATARN